MSFEKIITAIAEGEAEETLELTKQALAQGYPAKAILEKGLLTGINGVAEKFREAKVNVPEVLMASRAVHAGLSAIEPLLAVPARKGLGKIVVGTVAGDLHDIGLSLVKTMALSVGTCIIDLGVDVTPKKFARVVRRERPDILMISALLTTTMNVMHSVIEELEEQGLRKDLKIVVGGAPVTEDFAKEIGADYYFEDAFRVREFLEENLSKIVTAKRLMHSE